MVSRIYLDGQPVTPRKLLRIARTSAGLTQRDIGSALGVTPECVAHWERARHDSKTESFLAAVEACGYRVVVERAK